MKHLLFYGDSNTWGFDPASGGRYPLENRWTTICAGLLGPEYDCVSAGMNGRTTAFDDPVKGCRNGISGLDYELQSHKPLDLMVIMLGTNDLKYTDAAGSAEGMEQLVRQVLTANERFCLSSPVFPDGAQILLVAPVLITGEVNQCLACDEQKESRKLADLYGKIAIRNGLHFMDASQVTGPSDTDGVHLSSKGHALLGTALAERIQALPI